MCVLYISKQNYKELAVPLSQLPVNEYTCAELVRLCLRRRDVTVDPADTASQDSDDSESEEGGDDEVVSISMKHSHVSSFFLAI